MDSPFAPDQKLPLFRRDLKVFKGPEDTDGSPTFSVYDPVRAAYFKISWAEAAILENLKPGMTAGELIGILQKKSTLNLTLPELTFFYQDAFRHGLLEHEHKADQLALTAAKEKLHPVKAFLLYYLFFRVPLLNPDAFLTRTLHRVTFLLTPLALKIYVLIWICGLASVAVQWDAFASTFSYFFSLEGVAAYFLAIAVTKSIHEFAHAYTAKKYGLRIPTMGVAFLVLFPVLYTDVTDAWRLASRQKRMVISAAGIVAELTVAAIASILWSYTAPGVMQSVFFVLASASWIHTLVINLNPALRFDGYYLLMDWLAIENLQTRAFHVLRCAVYRVLLGMPVPNPEPKLSVKTQHLLAIYAIYTFLYRLILYTAIALFVYHEFTKTLGIFLFAVEILLFFIWPVVYEVTAFQRVKHLATLNERSVATLGALMLLLFWAVIPLPHTLSFPAITIAVDDRAIYVPADAQIQEIKVSRQSPVSKGDVLVILSSKELSYKLSSLRTQAEVDEKKLEIAKESEKLRSYSMEKQAELAHVQAETDAVAREIEQLRIAADTAGYLYNWDEKLKPGQFVSKDQVLGHEASLKELDVVCYVPERDIDALYIGQEVRFRSNASLTTAEGVVARIPPVRALNLTYQQLASENGGPLAVVPESSKEMVLLESYFPVTVSLKERKNLSIGEEGTISVKGPWSSYLFRLLNSVIAVLWQEGNV